VSEKEKEKGDGVAGPGNDSVLIMKPQAPKLDRAPSPRPHKRTLWPITLRGPVKPVGWVRCLPETRNRLHICAPAH